MLFPHPDDVGQVIDISGMHLGVVGCGAPICLVLIVVVACPVDEFTTLQLRGRSSTAVAIKPSAASCRHWNVVIYAICAA